MPRIRYLAQLCLYRLTLVYMKYWPLYELCIFGCNPSTPPVHHQIGLSAYRFEVILSRTHAHVHRDPERICSAFAFPPPLSLSSSLLLTNGPTGAGAGGRRIPPPAPAVFGVAEPQQQQQPQPRAYFLTNEGNFSPHASPCLLLPSSPLVGRSVGLPLFTSLTPPLSLSRSLVIFGFSFVNERTNANGAVRARVGGGGGGEDVQQSRGRRRGGSRGGGGGGGGGLEEAALVVEG